MQAEGLTSKKLLTAHWPKLNVPATALFSTLGRTAARGLESILVAQWALEFYDQLITNIKNGDTRMANMEKFKPESLARCC